MSTESYAPPANLKSRLATSYDAIAPEYNTWTVAHSTLRLEWLAKVTSLLPATSPSPLRILELGAGAGIPTSKALLDHSENVHVVLNDISGGQLALAKENLKAYAPRAEFLESDMMSLSFPPGSLSAVLGFYSIIHLPCDEQLVLLKRIAGWLKPGGLFLANFGEQETQGHILEKWMGEGGWMYWAGLGVEKTVKTVEEGGLVVVEREVLDDSVDKSRFLWVLARKGGV